jgi:hypothetical protein
MLGLLVFIIILVGSVAVMALVNGLNAVMPALFTPPPPTYVEQTALELQENARRSGEWYDNGCRYFDASVVKSVTEREVIVVRICDVERHRFSTFTVVNRVSDKETHYTFTYCAGNIWRCDFMFRDPEWRQATAVQAWIGYSVDYADYNTAGRASTAIFEFINQHPTDISDPRFSAPSSLVESPYMVPVECRSPESAVYLTEEKVDYPQSSKGGLAPGWRVE